MLTPTPRLPKRPMWYNMLPLPASSRAAWSEASMVLKVVLEPSEEGGYTAHVPALPGCISEGETIQEAMRNIREAAELYLEPIDQSCN